MRGETTYAMLAHLQAARGGVQEEMATPPPVLEQHFVVDTRHHGKGPIVFAWHPQVCACVYICVCVCVRVGVHINNLCVCPSGVLVNSLTPACSVGDRVIQEAR
jgi:hypothetical protein